MLSAVTIEGQKGQYKDHWLLDTGATTHMVCALESMTNPTLLNPVVPVTLGDNTVINATHRGTVHLKINNQGHERFITLHNSLYVPALNKNFINPNILVPYHSVQHSPEEHIVFNSSGEVIIHAVIRKDIGYVDAQVVKEEINSMSSGISIELLYR